MKEIDIFKKIYPSVVTYGSDWMKMLKEVSNFKLTEISLFLTCVNYSERKKIYAALEKTKINNIPHVHIRHDMREEELDFLVSNYHTKAFTTHYQYFLKSFSKSKYRKQMYIENNGYTSTIKNLNVFKKVGGVCIDLSHLVHHRNKSIDKYNTAVLAVKKYKVGCNHLSAVLSNGKSWHKVSKLSDLDYLKTIAPNYFSDYICLELGNPIHQQLKFKKYIAELLAKSWR